MLQTVIFANDYLLCTPKVYRKCLLVTCAVKNSCALEACVSVSCVCPNNGPLDHYGSGRVIRIPWSFHSSVSVVRVRVRVRVR